MLDCVLCQTVCCVGLYVVNISVRLDVVNISVRLCVVSDCMLC